MSGLVSRDVHLAASANDARTADHTWQLRGVDFEDGDTLRRFECVWCEAVRFD